MKKRIMGFLAAISALVFCFALSGCGGNNYAKNFIGTWELSGMESEGEVMSEDDMALMKGLGIDFSLTFEEDGTAKLVLAGEEAKMGTWEAKDATTCEITIDGEPQAVKLVDGVLTLEAEGAKAMFKKTDSAGMPKADSGKPEGTPAPDKDTNPAALSMNKVIADDELCTITVTGIEEDLFGDPGYKMTLKNNTADKTLYFSCPWDEFTVNNKMVDPLLSVTVKPGAYAEDFMSFDHDDIGGGVEALKNIKGILEVSDDETFDLLREYNFAM